LAQEAHPLLGIELVGGPASAELDWAVPLSFAVVLRHDYSPDYADRSKLKEQEIAAEEFVAQLLAWDEASRVTTWH
jgi:hypothetical protein